MAYLNYKIITIDHTKCGTADTTDFTMKVSFTDADLKTVANGGSVQNGSGYDIVFSTATDGSALLSWKLEKYVPTTGEIIGWVKIPSLTYASDTVIYLCYNNSSISTFQGGATGSEYSSYYKLVNHFGDGSTLSLADATGINSAWTNDGLTAGTGLTYGGAVDNSTQGAYLADTTNFNLGSGDFAIGMWIKWDTVQFPGTLCIPFSKGKYGLSFDWGFVMGSATNLEFWSSGGAQKVVLTIPTMTTGVWYRLIATKIGSTVYLYFCATTSGSASVIMTNIDTSYISLGRYSEHEGSTGFGFTGTIDDVFLMKGSGMTSSWVTADYNNQLNPSTFYTVTNPGGGTTTQTITGKARIQATTTQTETGKARIQITSTQTETGKSRIQKNVIQTETGITRIQKSVTKTETGVARIQKSVTQTESGIARIQKSVSQTESGVGRIQKSVSQTITGVSNIASSGTSSKNITGVASIKKTTTQTESGVARIQKTGTQTETGVARIQLTTTRTESGVGRIQKTTTQTETGVASIKKTTTQTITGKSNIVLTTPQTITGVSRIQKTILQNETGVASIKNITTRTITGVANIRTSTPTGGRLKCWIPDLQEWIS